MSEGSGAGPFGLGGGSGGAGAAGAGAMTSPPPPAPAPFPPPQPLLTKESGNALTSAAADVLDKAAAPFQNLANPSVSAFDKAQAVVGAVAGLPGMLDSFLDDAFARATSGISRVLPSFPAATIGSMVLGMPHTHTHPPSLIPPAPPIPLPALAPCSLAARRFSSAACPPRASGISGSHPPAAASPGVRDLHRLEQGVHRRRACGAHGRRPHAAVHGAAPRGRRRRGRDVGHGEGDGRRLGRRGDGRKGGADHGARRRRSSGWSPRSREAAAAAGRRGEGRQGQGDARPRRSARRPTRKAKADGGVRGAPRGGDDGRRRRHGCGQAGALERP